jgi:hypothetical protein
VIPRILYHDELMTEKKKNKATDKKCEERKEIDELRGDIGAI